MTARLMASGRKRSGFTPATIANLRQWCKADAITGIANGAQVGTWSDLSGNGFNFTQSGSLNQPTFETNQVNGLPVLRASLVNPVWMTSTLPTTSTSAFCMFAVMKNRTTGTDQEVPYFLGTDPNGYGISVATYSTRRKGFIIGGIAWVDSATPEATAFDIYVLRREAGTTKLWVNGGAVAASNASTPNAPTGSGRIFYHGAGNYCDTDVLEVGCYSTAPTMTEVNQLGAYLAARSALTWATAT